jgi:hypothetical protein
MVNNYLTYKMLLYNIRSNNSFIPCTINKNIVSCDNKIIEKDIVKKITNLKIDHMTFYIFSQSYNNKDEAYYNTVKDLPLKLLPTYKKTDNLQTFIKHYCEFNIDTTYITKTINSRADLSRDGTMLITSLFNYSMITNKKEDNFYMEQRFLCDTINNMFNNGKCGIIVGIKSNKLILFASFHNNSIKCDNQYEQMFRTLIKTYTINDCTFVINVTDSTVVYDTPIPLSPDESLQNVSNTLNKIILYKNMPINPIKIAIIACYRDNPSHSRFRELQLYKYVMSKMLINNNIDFRIIIVEQNFVDKFNIGKLKNIGFHYINSKETFDNYVFTDIDMIPDYKLLPYFTTVTDGFNTLAMRGTRYSAQDKHNNKKEFFGGCIACTKDIYEQVNGYSNLYSRGWGGEDDNLTIRTKHEKITNYVPKKGSIIDTESIDGKPISLSNKLSMEKKVGNYDTIRYEMILKHNLYKEDGLTNLNYTVQYSTFKNNIYHIIVDPEQAKHEKDYPSHFNIEGFTMKKYEDEKQIIKRMPLKQVFI